MNCWLILPWILTAAALWIGWDARRDRKELEKLEARVKAVVEAGLKIG